MSHVKKLFTVEYINSSLISHVFYIYQNEMMCIIYHFKSKQYTDCEFNVTQFLLSLTDSILFLYLIYIHLFAELLCCEQKCQSHFNSVNCLLFYSLQWESVWLANNNHHLLIAVIWKMWSHSINSQKYWQLFIRITEKHICISQLSFNLNQDTDSDADSDMIFVW